MKGVDYSIINEAIMRYSEWYPDGNDWGDAMFEYHNGDYEQSQCALKYLRENDILIPWGNAGGNRLMLSSIGIDILEQFNGDIIKYLEHKETMKRKAEAEHELEMNVRRSTLKSHIVQKRATLVNVIIGIINVICAIINVWIALR